MRKGKLKIYQDKSGGWRWTLKGGNGRIVADSGQSYGEKWLARRAARDLAVIARTAKEIE